MKDRILVLLEMSFTEKFSPPTRARVSTNFPSLDVANRGGQYNNELSFFQLFFSDELMIIGIARLPLPNETLPMIKMSQKELLFLQFHLHNSTRIQQ